MKLTKQQRRKRRMKKRLEYNKRKKQRLLKLSKEPQPWQPVKMKFVNVPNPFPKSVTKKQRLQVIRSIGSKAKKDFEEKYPTIEKWFKKYDAIYILSFCAAYFTSSVEGIDPEATGHLDFPNYLLEIKQAFSLYQERSLHLKPLSSDAENLQKEMREIGNLMILRLVDIPSNLKKDDEINAYHLRSEMMGSTTAIRNWAYFHQIKRVVLDLAEKIDEDFKNVYGIGSLAIMKMLFKLTEERNDLLNEHLNKIRTIYKKRKNNYKVIIETYNQIFPENKAIVGGEVEKIWEMVGKNKSNLIGMLIYHSDLKLEKVYSFDLDHAASLLNIEVSKKKLESILDRLSYNFGELKGFNIDHIVLDNPVFHKPFIKTGNNTYFSAIWATISHIALDIFEDFLADDGKLREKFSQIKANYLEDEVEKLFRSNFPNAKVLRGSIWKDPVSGKDYENDLTVLIESFAIIVEDKSRSITPPARRGASARLFETLKELIEDPSEQALRFIERLKGEKGIVSYRTKKGGTNIIDAEKIKYFIPLGVTFHQLGMISSNIKKLIEAKIVDKTIDQLIPSISFTDLETVFNLLSLEAEKIHYLSRRRELEAHFDYEGDELDLLAFYLDNGFNIGELEYNREMALNLTLKSKELDPYIIGTSQGKNIPKPHLSMTEWWSDILRAITAKKIEGWVETAFVMLNTTKEDQEKFEKKMQKLKRKILAGKVQKPHNWVMFITGPERRRYVIAGYPYVTQDKELRNGVMSRILDEPESEKARGVLIIGINMKYPNYPYNVLARRMSTDLFDTLKR